MTTCDICGDREATISLKQAFNGTVKEVHLCEDCATKQGVQLPSPAGLADFLFGMEVRSDPQAPEKTCSACGRKVSEFQKDSRMGCETCYESFAGELEDMLAELQPGRSHIGKVPASAKVQTELASYLRRLKEAVAAEDFEEAARLRDRIRDLKAEDRGRAGKPPAQDPKPARDR